MYSTYYGPQSGLAGADATAQGSSWMTSFMGLSSIFAALGLVSQSYVGSSLKLLVLGSLIETGRRFFQWLIERFRIQYSLTAQFNEGDPAHEWIVLFITQERVWKRSREFVVTAKNSERKWAVNTDSDPSRVGSAEYVPTYQAPQLFKWGGYWVEIKRGNDARGSVVANGVSQTGRIYLTIYTLDMTVLSRLVEEAKKRYVEVNRPHVVIHLIDSRRFNSSQPWNSVKHKIRRPLSSIILLPGLLDSLVQDAEEFLKSEDWYIGAGIPHRRGYLLHGPPGTGKTSTIYALAGALNLEIYSLSLASNNVDDSFLQQAASSIPKNGIFLIEDIDCAFPSRADEEDEPMEPMTVMRGNAMMARARAPRAITLSGLLNVIDGVGSEEGKLFFATTNYIDRLDAALLRPGRIDRKIEYALSTDEQTRALFVKFFPEARFPQFAHATETEKRNADAEKNPTLTALATEFSAAIPPREFSTAELQGYLQGHKMHPVEAARGAGAGAWVEAERAERAAREVREEERRAKARMRAQQMGGQGYMPPQMAGAGLGGSGMNPVPMSSTAATPTFKSMRTGNVAAAAPVMT
ncbi:P-loop containing nucleoside triphosphate hydrolase protein [Mycena pura]|uniref:P-loop containing nucleoside triphosphate hydrolase protein n=1 Tax=Mycena pura TaxID=153505 RepID=A0AAD6VJ35_9AGAR|nr:P-loop containing nucleoside triphosphate hydrolase protein [Mycena pura]